MKLNKYFKDLTEDVRFKDIKDDSRLVKKNDLFFAIRGENYNGEKYISEAIENGASYIISKKTLTSYPSIKAENPKELLNSMLNFYYTKHKLLHNIAVTGTDGKTTTSYLLNHILNDVSRSILIGTNGVYFLKKHFKTNNTTPSNEDTELTNKLFEIGNIMSIPLLDHIIIGKDNYYSFYENMHKK